MPAPRETLNYQPGNPPLPFPWREYISTSGSTAEVSWEAGGSAATMFMDIMYQDRQAAVQSLLGYSVRNNTNPTPYLNRNLPWPHPDWNWLWCTKVSPMRGIDWQEKDEGPTGSPFSGYGMMRLQLTFQSLPYDPITDQQLVEASLKEWDRFVIKTSKPTTEFSDTGLNQFQQVGGGPSTGKKFKAPLGRKIAKTTLVWKWMYVPENWIFKTAGNAPNIEAALGTVNLTTFEGRNPGTLYLDSVEFEPVNAPVSPSLLGFFSWSSPRMWNVVLNFILFEPLTDLEATYNHGLGHNLIPDLQSAQGFWYDCQSVGGGQPLYQSTEFANIFAFV